MCSNKDRVSLFTEGTDELGELMEKEDKTDPETSYWLPMYINKHPRHNRVPRPWKNVSKYDSPCKEPRQHRMEEFNGRTILHLLDSRPIEIPKNRQFLLPDEHENKSTSSNT